MVAFEIEQKKKISFEGKDFLVFGNENKVKKK